MCTVLSVCGSNLTSLVWLVAVRTATPGLAALGTKEALRCQSFHLQHTPLPSLDKPTAIV